jgi:hypothetical protein
VVAVGTLANGAARATPADGWFAIRSLVVDLANLPPSAPRTKAGLAPPRFDTADGEASVRVGPGTHTCAEIDADAAPILQRLANRYPY